MLATKKFLVRAGAALLFAGLATVTTTTGANAQTVMPHTEFHEIRNVNDNLCLQPANTVFGAHIVQEPCNGSSTQGWEHLDNGDNVSRFLNTDGFCIFVTGNTLANGVPVLQENCESAGEDTVSNAEFFHATKLPDVVELRSRLHFKNSGFCLDVPGGSAQ